MDDEAAELMGQLMTASLAQTQDVTNRVIDSLTADLADAHATVDAIRSRIWDLLDGPYMPSADALNAALWPNEEEREPFRRDHEAQ
jgi:hypothetical protein